MKIQKITPGFVIQTYDTKTGRCVEQSFIAGEDDDVAYENENGDAVDWREEEDAYQPLEHGSADTGFSPCESGANGLDL